MKVEYIKELTIRVCRENPDKVFIFGDNLKAFGKGGQATIRDEPNAFGIPTKRYPSWDERAFFSDKEDEILAVKESLRSLYKTAQNKVVVFPEDGIGTGRANMKEKSPIAYKVMCDILSVHFGVLNGVINGEEKE